jgi:hypothetical protein
MAKKKTLPKQGFWSRLLYFLLKGNGKVFSA